MHTRNAMVDFEDLRMLLRSDLTCTLLKFIPVTSAMNFCWHRLKFNESSQSSLYDST